MQKFKISVSKEAEIDILEAYVYYESQKRGLGKSFVENLESGYEIIRNNPEAFVQNFMKLVCI